MCTNDVQTLAAPMRTSVENFIEIMSEKCREQSKTIETLQAQLKTANEKVNYLTVTVNVLLSPPSAKKAAKRKLSTATSPKGSFKLNLSSDRSHSAKKRRCQSPDSMDDDVSLLLVLIFINIVKREDPISPIMDISPSFDFANILHRIPLVKLSDAASSSTGSLYEGWVINDDGEVDEKISDDDFEEQGQNEKLVDDEIVVGGDIIADGEVVSDDSRDEDGALECVTGRGHSTSQVSNRESESWRRQKPPTEKSSMSLRSRRPLRSQSLLNLSCSSKMLHKEPGASKITIFDGEEVEVMADQHSVLINTKNGTAKDLSGIKLPRCLKINQYYTGICNDDCIEIYERNGATQTWDGAGVNDIAIGGIYLALACSDRTVRVIDLDAQAEINLLKHDGVVSSVEIHDDLVVSTSADKMARVWEANKTRAEPERTLPHDSPCVSLDISPDGQSLAICHNEGITFWSLADYHKIGECKLGEAIDVRFQTDKQAVVVLVNGEIHLVTVQ